MNDPGTGASRGRRRREKHSCRNSPWTAHTVGSQGLGLYSISTVGAGEKKAQQLRQPAALLENPGSILTPTWWLTTP